MQARILFYPGGCAKKQGGKLSLGYLRLGGLVL